MQAGGLITAQEATRRVLILRTRGSGGRRTITGSLFAGLQLILPGEIAPAHRHTQSALRFIIEGHGAYTAVDGERTAMQPGDFVITPSWTWHDHGNETGASRWSGSTGSTSRSSSCSAPASPSAGAADMQPVTRPEGDSFARFGNNLLPVDWKPEVKTSPVFNYPYARTREALDALARNGEPDPYHGHKLRYVNPASGEFAMPTIGTFVQLLPARLREPALPLDRRHRVCLRRGQGRDAAIGDQVFSRWDAARHLCRAGLDAAHPSRRRARPCCSASPTGRCRKSSGSGARPAATRHKQFEGNWFTNASSGRESGDRTVRTRFALESRAGGI